MLNLIPMKRTILVLGVFFAGLTLCLADSAEYLEVRNETGFVIAALYISSSDSEDWGDNRLSGEPLNNTDEVQISQASLPDSLVDIRARDSEGDTYTLYEVDARDSDVVLKLTDIDPD